ncbi:MAG: hypothetical protein OXU20_30420 [Myxococcales bacterium]|nr:hypothetical protein [Myxococcales bacterium]MDD9968940.1 hypothetical protein [Myxococcales bacterium]
MSGGPGPVYRAMMRNLFVVSVVALGGCVPANRPPPEMPGLEVDEIASQVEFKGAFDAASLRGIVADELARLSVERSGDGDTRRPARFMVSATQSVSPLPAILCLGVYTLFGCPTTLHEIRVELTLEVGGARYEGAGSAKHAGFLYYNQRGEAVAREAVGHALQDALARGPVGA